MPKSDKKTGDKSQACNEAALLFGRIKDRLGLRTKAFLDRLADLGFAVTEGQLSNWLKPGRKFPRDWGLIRAIIQVFVAGQPEKTRCTAQEAIEFGALVEMPISEFNAMAALFDPAEYARVWKEYGPAIPDRDSPVSLLPKRPYSALIGRDSHISKLFSALSEGRDHMLALDGMGGIGKSAIALEIAYHTVEQGVFEQALWISAAPNDPNAITALTFEKVLDAIGSKLGFHDVALANKKIEAKKERVKEILHGLRVLVVLDNLETAREPQRFIANELLPLLGPSKALLTSRHRFGGGLRPIHLGGLAMKEAKQFIRYAAVEKELECVLNADEVRQIAKSTGGSPLAMNLVVGQLLYLPAEGVLAHLEQVKPLNTNTEDDELALFYRSIFESSWRVLSAESQRLLFGVSCFEPGVGGKFAALKVLCPDEAILYPSLDQLWHLSLLEVASTFRISQRRYFLHPLTRNFVRAHGGKDVS